MEYLAEVRIETLTPNLDFLPVNIEYFFAFSYSLSPMCIDRNEFTILEEVSDFDKAIETFGSYIQDSDLDIYLCVPAEYNKRVHRMPDYKYYICKIHREDDEIIIND